ncbi:MAG: hypothetical protein JXB29_13160 [Sedimentisphaerales bacterium]|nr:hypothetical protein [Sedimentisphaerales bacterium]
MSYSCLEGGHLGIGNIDADPCFLDIDSNDLHLKSYSPCINGGNSSGDYTGQTDLDSQQRVRYGIVDMGAYEVYPIAGDFEPDEDVDFVDFALFAQFFHDEGCSVGGCELYDINEDLSVDLEDLAYFCEHWLYGK